MRPRRAAIIPSDALKFVDQFYDLAYAHLSHSYESALREASIASPELGPQTPLRYTLRPTTCAIAPDDGNFPNLAALPIAICRARCYLWFYPPRIVIFRKETIDSAKLFI